MTDRRKFLKVAGMGAAVAALPTIGKGAAHKSKSGADIMLGVASYNLREFTTAQALDMILRCGVNRTTFKSMHLPLDSSPATIKSTLELCKKKGVTLYGAGVITMKTKAEADQAFEYAKAAKLEMIVGVAYPEILEYVEAKVKKYNVKMAIHNHGPGDDLYPSAEVAFEKIKNMDKRMGLCLDIGHTKRINRDPEKDFIKYFDRIFDVHIKDVTPSEEHPEGYTCIMGRGDIDIVSFVRTVVDMEYKGTLSLEYEPEPTDPLPAMMASMGYLKGVLATMS